jgi:glycosyltransferase involved in cell wall biosynthesis
MKKVLIDLLKLDNLFVGLGQVSLHYGKAMAKLAEQQQEEWEFHFLVPKKYIGYFGTAVKYKTKSNFSRYFPFLNSGYDVWHSIHQDSAYYPSSKTKWILTIHDLNFLTEKSESKAKRRLQQLQNKVNKVSMVACISNFAAEAVRQNLGCNSRSVAVIYNGVEMMGEAISNTTIQAKKEQAFLFSIGHISAKKNLQVLLPMMQLLPQLTLYIAGDDTTEYAMQLKRQVQEQQITNCIFIGKISDQEKASYLQQCAALVFPSLLEGFGLPVIEAMSCSKPVLLSNATCLPEIAGKYGYYWQNFEPQAMSHLVKEVLLQEPLNTHLIAERKAHAHQFTWQKNADSYFKIYQQVVQY